MRCTRVERMKLRDTREFKSTNTIWNDLKLNIGWSIGYLTYLHKISGATTFTEWETYYFISGRRRIQAINKLPILKKQMLLNHNLYRESPMTNVNLLSRDEMSLNTHMGRTIDELNIIAKELYKGVIANELRNISLVDCQDYTYIRVLDETWLGVERELNTKQTLQNLMPKYEVRDVSIEIDRKYAVDFEIYLNDKLFLAVQVKSSKYHMNTSDILLRTKSYNSDKNKKYQDMYGVPVINVYSDLIGRICNLEEFNNCVSTEVNNVI